MIEQLKKLKYPPIIVLASRTNIFDRTIDRLDSFSGIKEFHMPNLQRQEIIDIIKILNDNNLLGYLKGLSEESRIKEFENRAKKQILVAMREATHGRDFDEIIKSEFEQINPTEARLLCLCVSLTTDAGFTISKQEFVSFSTEPPATILDYLNRTLKDIILIAGPKKDKLILRHRLIAEYIIEGCANQEMLKKAYIMLLSSLANEINNSNHNRRKFFLYKEIINHATIYKRFSKNISQAREVYESLANYFNQDFQFWLQYGSLELEGVGGNLQLAENYLNQALSLKPNNLLVQTAIANLYYKKALHTNNNVEAISFKEYADSILIENMSNRSNNDPYIYHIYAKGYYEYALKWANGNRMLLKTWFQEIHKVTKQATNLHPHDKRLKVIDNLIFKAVLMTQVDNDSVQFPVLLNETDY
jgi:hypothetical protein